MDNSDVKKYIDVDSALQRVRGSKPVYLRMLQLFLDSKEFDALESSLAEKD